MELDSLKSLLSFESELQKKGLLKVFAPTRKLQTAFDTAKGVMNPDSPMLVFVQKQLRQIIQIRIGGVILILLVGFLYVSSLSEWFEFFESHSIATTSTNISTIVSPAIPSQVVNPIKTLTHTDIPSATPIDTIEPTPTFVPLAYGKLLASYFTPYDEPNKNMLDISLKRGQFLIILSTKEDHGALWYECIWEVDGVAGKGWILAEKIKIVQPPTPTP
jgi:hypothetical protein